MVNANTAAKAIGMMSLMKFFPSDKEFRAALLGMLGEMCETDGQVLWLAKRVQVLYQEWPGAHELRACFCSKFSPKDGIEVYSGVYVDGIPSEREIAPGETKQIASGERLQLRGEVSEPIVDPEFDKMVSDLAKALEMPKREPRTVQEISEALYGRRLAANAAQETETGRTESLQNLAALADLGSEAET